jgi:hypothetical protein
VGAQKRSRFTHLLAFGYHRASGVKLKNQPPQLG